MEEYLSLCLDRRSFLEKGSASTRHGIQGSFGRLDGVESPIVAKPNVVPRATASHKGLKCLGSALPFLDATSFWAGAPSVHMLTDQS